MRTAQGDWILTCDSDGACTVDEKSKVSERKEKSDDKSRSGADAKAEDEAEEDFSKVEKDMVRTQLNPFGEFSEDAAQCFLGMMRALVTDTVSTVARRVLEKGRDRIDPADIAAAVQQDESFRRLVSGPDAVVPVLDSIRGTCVVVEGAPQSGTSQLVERMLTVYENADESAPSASIDAPASVSSANINAGTDAGVRKEICRQQSDTFAEDGSVDEGDEAHPIFHEHSTQNAKTSSFCTRDDDTVRPGRFSVPPPPPHLGIEAYAWATGMLEPQLNDFAKKTGAIIVQNRGHLSAHVLSSFIATKKSGSGWIPTESTNCQQDTIKVFIHASPAECHGAEAKPSTLVKQLGMKSVNDFTSIGRLYFEAMSHSILEDTSIGKIGSSVIVVPFRDLALAGESLQEIQQAGRDNLMALLWQLIKAVAEKRVSTPKIRMMTQEFYDKRCETSTAVKLCHYNSMDEILSKADDVVKSMDRDARSVVMSIWKRVVAVDKAVPSEEVVFSHEVWREARNTPEARLLVLHHLANFQSLIIIRPPPKKIRIPPPELASS